MTSIIRHPVRRGGCIRFGILAGILVLCVMLTGLLAVGIWPGELKLTAPFVCPEGKTDAYVVVDSYQTPPNKTSYNFALYCMGPRGNFENAGFGVPFFILSVFHTALLLIVAMFFMLLTALRRRRRRATGKQPRTLPGAPLMDSHSKSPS
jgi:hypothetical protein